MKNLPSPHASQLAHSVTKIPAPVFLAALVLLSLSSAHAVDGTWKAGTGSGVWSATTNWTGNPNPVPGGAGSKVGLNTGTGGSVFVTIDGAVASRTVGTLDFGGSSIWTVASGSGGTLTFDNSGSNAVINIEDVAAATLSNHVINAPVILNSSLIINANDPMRGLGTGAAGVISGAGSITKNGPGGLGFYFSAVNTFAGGFTLNGGEVGASNNSSFGSGTLTLNSGSIVNTGGYRGYANTLVLGGDVTLNTAGGGSNNFSGTTTLTGSRILTVESAVASLIGNIGESSAGYGITKTGTGSLTLSGSNTYSGTTTLTAGTMIVGNNSALGTGKTVVSGASAATLKINSGITVGNNIVYSSSNASSAIERVVANSASFNVGTTGTLTSDFAGGTDNTTASLLAGSGATTLTMSFAPTATASNDGSRISDVFDLSLSTSRTYVLQLTTGVVGSDPLYLGWLDGGAWVEATTGNTGTPGSLAGPHAMTWDAFVSANGAFNATTMLGAYGYDETTTTAWAVLDHNSEFALVVPEPTTLGLLGLSLTVLVALRRRRTA